MNTVLGARGFASSSKQIGAWRPVTGRVWDGNAGRALPVDPSDQTQIDHDTRQDGGRRRRYVSNIPAAWTDPRGPYPWLVVRKDPQLLVDGQCRSDEPDQPPCTACTNCARMYCDLCSNRTTNAYCPNRGCRKFTKQSLDEHAARYHKQEVGSHNVRQQLSEEEVRIRTRQLCILLTVLFLARQHIALRKLPFVAKLVHSFGSTTFTLGRPEIKFTARPPWVAPQLGGSGAGRGRGGKRQRERRGK